jgi:hypothetical protein
MENIEVEFGSIYFRPHYYSAYIWLKYLIIQGRG